MQGLSPYLRKGRGGRRGVEDGVIEKHVLWLLPIYMFIYLLKINESLYTIISIKLLMSFLSTQNLIFKKKSAR